MSLKQKTLSGIAWTFGQQVGVQGINFVVMIILARLLAPSDFGLIAIIQIFLSIGKALMDGGMTSSLIRTENADQRDYSTVFFINLFASIGIYLILFFTAPLIASFFDQNLLVPIIRIYTISFIIQAFVGVQTTRLTKELNFKLQMYMQVPSSLIGGISGVLMAYNDFGVWSLVWMHLITTILFMLQHWFWTDWRPSFIIDKKKLKYHFNFGYKITISSLLTEVYRNINKIVIAKYFSVIELGIYTQADNLRIVPVRHLTSALQKVTYPIFSSIQNDNDRLRSGLKQITSLVFFVISPIMFGLSLIAEPLFRWVLTDKWLPSVPYFQILAISSIFYPVSLYNLNIILAKGRSDLHVKSEVIKKSISLFALILIIPFGLMGAAYAGAISMLVHALVNFIYCGKLINYSLIQQLKDISPVLIISLISSVLAYIIQLSVLNLLDIMDPILIIVNFIILFVIYMGLAYIFKISSLYNVYSIIVNLLKHK